MGKPVKKLFDLEIDEVSVVDRAANQHSLIAFSKSLGEDQPLEGSMPELAIYEETGEEVDVDTLEHGDIVYDEDGNEFVFIEDDGEEVGKAGQELVHVVGRGTAGAGRHVSEAEMTARRAGSRAYGYGRKKAGQVYYKTRNRYTDVDGKAKAGLIARDSAIAGGTGLVLTGAGGGAYAAHEKWGGGKSLGDTVLEELSKAVTERDREEVIAKMADEVEFAKAQAAEAWAYAEGEADVRITQEFISKAATYNLPVSPEVLGPILKSMAEVLDEDQLDIIDELFNAVGDALYNEIGYVGESSNSSVIDAVDAYANELVGKSDLTHEQATVAMFEANPAAYDAYISEKGN